MWSFFLFFFYIHYYTWINSTQFFSKKCSISTARVYNSIIQLFLFWTRFKKVKRNLQEKKTQDKNLKAFADRRERQCVYLGNSCGCVVLTWQQSPVYKSKWHVRKRVSLWCRKLIKGLISWKLSGSCVCISTEESSSDRNDGAHAKNRVNFVSPSECNNTGS